jgi:hypothetical protein
VTVSDSCATTTINKVNSNVGLSTVTVVDGATTSNTVTFTGADDTVGLAYGDCGVKIYRVCSQANCASSSQVSWANVTGTSPNYTLTLTPNSITTGVSGTATVVTANAFHLVVTITGQSTPVNS